MDPNRIALVRTTWSNGEVRVGTAYLISELLLITARHVVAEFGPPERVEARLRGVNKPWQDVKWLPGTAERQEEKADTPDLAFLEMDSPQAGIPPVAFAEPPSSVSAWEGGGFLAHEKKGLLADDVYAQKYIGLSGKLYPPATGDQRINLSVESPVPTAKDWAGISGGPAFVGGCLVACISNATEIFDGNQVRAVPILQSLPDEIRHLFDQPPTQRAIEGIAAVFAKKPALVGPLCELLALEEGDAALVAQQLATKVPLVDAFCSLRQILLSGDRILPSAVVKNATKTIAGWLWAARSREIPGEVDEGSKKGKINAPPGIGHAWAEAWMANRAGAPAEWEVAGDPATLRSPWAIGLPPEPGLKAEDVISHLQEALGKLYPNRRIVVSGDVEDLVREISGRVGIDESTRRRPRP